MHAESRSTSYLLNFEIYYGENKDERIIMFMSDGVKLLI